MTLRIPTLAFAALFAFAPTALAADDGRLDDGGPSVELAADLTADALVLDALYEMLDDLDGKALAELEPTAEALTDRALDSTSMRADLADSLPDIYAMILRGESAEDVANAFEIANPELSRAIDAALKGEPAMFPWKKVGLTILIIVLTILEL